MEKIETIKKGDSMNSAKAALSLAAIIALSSALHAEKLTQLQKNAYEKDMKYQDIAGDPDGYIDKKIMVRISFIETARNQIKTYKDILPDSYDLIKFEGASDDLPVVFSNKDEYLKDLLGTLEKNAIISLYCDVSYKTNKEKEKKGTNVDKRYFMKVVDVELPGETAPEGADAPASDFEFVKPIRIDIQYREMVDKKLKTYLHFSEIGQKLPPMVSKFSQKSEKDFFCLLPKEKMSLPIVASRKDENIISGLENLTQGELIVVFAVLRKAENPATSADEPSYFLELLKVEKE